MAIATVRPDVPEALDPLLHLAAEGTLDDVGSVDDLRDHADFLVVQLIRLLVRIDAGLRENVVRELRTNPVDIPQRIADLLLFRNVDTSDTGHQACSSINPGAA